LGGGLIVGLLLGAVGAFFALGFIAVGATVGEGLLLASTAILGPLGAYLSSRGVQQATTSREKTAANIGLWLFILGLAAGPVLAGVSSNIKPGKFTNLDPNASADEIQVGEFLASELGVDVTQRAPSGPRGPGTADYSLEFPGLDIKGDLYSPEPTTSLNNVVRTGVGKQGTYFIVKLAQGSVVTDAQAASIPGRIFGNAFSHANRIIVVRELAGGALKIIIDSFRYR
jgi:hypothetical protein